MCGIFASIGHAADSIDLDAALLALTHRGPDGKASYIDRDNHVVLGHTRLSIIDVATGAQPLVSQDGHKVLICNGEIYDHKRIREELVADGYDFSTGSDSELILYLYERDGLEFTRHLRGEFAFVLLDRRLRRVIACRDRFGIKPLFMHKLPGQTDQVLFASEAKALFASGLATPALDPVRLRDMLSFVPMDSLFEHVSVVPPGHFMLLELDSNTQSLHAYWPLDLLPEPLPETCTKESLQQTLRMHLEEAVGLRLQADVPVGVYLSGGLDSTAVAAVAAKLSDHPIDAFCVSFSDNADFDEALIAERTARHLGARFHKISCRRDDLLENLEDSLWYSETPAVNYNGVGKFLLSKLASQHVKCVLTGEGADEGLLGYGYFKDDAQGLSSHAYGRRQTVTSKASQASARELENTFGFVPQPEMAELFTPAAQRMLNSLFSARHRQQLQATSPLQRLRQRLDRRELDRLPRLNKLQTFSIRGLLSPFILANLGDRQEMAHSIEGRTPFLDHRLFHWLAKLPNEWKLRGNVEKYLLREAVKDIIPEEIYSRRKWPYITPPLWVSKRSGPAMKRLMDTYLSKPALVAAGVFSPVMVRLMLLAVGSSLVPAKVREKFNNLLLFMLSVQILEKQYIQQFSSNLQKHGRPSQQAERRATVHCPPATATQPG
ncbi:asparagine synthase (glutamine-hydrolyzing) [Pseudomonas sp. BP8]|uniref:asparagine synthase (glutamine-hydrolyzing) n=1 Tax=Pseudomonas sp. BP8 TaxID=2817864 RepID=UPI001AE563E4|nr:asparagine synthase (glutamine-hydrolyzing) [Pseudomonas sp. BP8]MBP2261341.1 asparagine synthase (glutamine-hydrolyzing) [Pseudomonas sp. BP8]HDS1734555.1 asparagine synthase (glutamine-hydrolyzing) [Pseudomonas putida]